MRTIRIYTPQELVADRVLTLEQPASQHLIQVLRLKQGSQITLFNGNGYQYPATLIDSDKKACRVQLKPSDYEEPASGLHITLALALSKGERMDFAFQKSVELGVNAIVPLITQRSVVKLDRERRQKKLTHWQKVVIGACEQSGRCRLPDMAPIQKIEEWLAADRSGGHKLILHPFNDKPITGITPANGPFRIILLIGPEGGLTDNEVELAVATGYRAVRIGPRILRTETAPLAAISALQTLWGDFRH